MTPKHRPKNDKGRKMVFFLKTETKNGFIIKKRTENILTACRPSTKTRSSGQTRTEKNITNSLAAAATGRRTRRRRRRRRRWRAAHSRSAPYSFPTRSIASRPPPPPRPRLHRWGGHPAAAAARTSAAAPAAGEAAGTPGSRRRRPYWRPSLVSRPPPLLVMSCSTGYGGWIFFS
jgi:hypothetical protein